VKVKDWIEWLSKQPPDNEVVLCDPDTEWWLVLKAEPTYPAGDVPANSTSVFADYHDRDINALRDE
jgi:hypothetical protein